MPAPWVALPRDVMDEVTKEGALVNVEQGPLCAFKDDVLAKFEGVVEHQTGVGDARSVGLVNPSDVAGQTVRRDAPTRTGGFQGGVHSGHGGVGPILITEHFGHVAKSKTDTVDFVGVGGSDATTGGANLCVEAVHVAQDDVHAR